MKLGADRSARREFAKAEQAFRVAEQLAQAGQQSKVGRDPGKPWHVEMR